jgi:hypothetical protein
MATKEGGKNDVCIGRLPPAKYDDHPEHLPGSSRFFKLAN